MFKDVYKICILIGADKIFVTPEDDEMGVFFSSKQSAENAKKEIDLLNFKTNLLKENNLWILKVSI